MERQDGRDDGPAIGDRPRNLSPENSMEGTAVRAAAALVDDINAAVEAAEKAGAMIALPPMEIPGHGTCAIYILGGVDHGLWQR